MKKYLILMILACMSQFISAQTAAEVINSYKNVPNAIFHSVSGEMFKASMPMNMARIPENVDKDALMAALDKIEKLDVLILPASNDLDNEKIEYQLADLKKSGYGLYADLAYYKLQDNIIKEILVNQVEQNSGMRVLMLINCSLTLEEAMRFGQMMKGFMPK